MDLCDTILVMIGFVAIICLTMTWSTATTYENERKKEYTELCKSIGYESHGYVNGEYFCVKNNTYKDVVFKCEGKMMNKNCKIYVAE